MTTDRLIDRQPTAPQRQVTTAIGSERRRGLPGRLLAQWSAAIVLVVTSVIGAAWLYTQKGETAEAIVVAREIAPGHEITSADLRTAQVSGIEAVAAADAASVIGKYAVVGMVPGQVLSPDAVTAQPMPAAGERLVALNLPAGRVPSGVRAGSAVEVLVAPAPGEGMTSELLDVPDVIAERATALTVESMDDGTVVVTLVLPDADADVVATHSAVGAVALVQIPLDGE